MVEKANRELEERVWQRIAGQPMAERGDLLQVLYLAMEQAADLGRLAGSLTGGGQKLAKQLQIQGEQTVRVIRGIRKLAGFPPPEPVRIPMDGKPSRHWAAQCFRRSGRLLTEYASRVLDPEFGTVWQILADRERSAAAKLAELAGITGA